MKKIAHRTKAARQSAIRCIGTIAAFLSFLAAAGCHDEYAPQIENVLLILLEDQGAHLGHIGTPGLKTPRMDALARSGVYFRESFVASPVCSPSKAALYTGRYPHSNGLRANTLDYMRPADELSAAQRRHPFYSLLRINEDVPTLIEILHDASFYTGVTGKLHVVPNEKFPFDRFILTRDVSDDPAAAVSDFIEAASRTHRPWFLLHSIRSPHRPFPNSQETPIDVSLEAIELPAFLPDTPVVRRDWAEYLAAIELADEQVGAALDALRDSGQSDHTLVLVMSDHGPAFQRGKMSLYDLGIRVPLMIQGPGISAGDSLALVSQIDVMPTLLEILDLPIPTGVQGRSLAALLFGRSSSNAETRSFVFAELGHGIPRAERGMRERSVYDGTFHMIYRDQPAKPRIVNNDIRRFEKWRNRTYDETIRERARFPEAWRMLREIDNARLGGRPPRVELYQLTDDPDEMHDLASKPEYQETRRRLMDALRRFARETGDHALRLPERRSPRIPNKTPVATPAR